MSIQPIRVLARIVEQVDRSDWPILESKIQGSPDGSEWIRVFSTTRHERYATPIHFWVHALRDELALRGRRQDLVGTAGQALCETQPVEEWRAELSADLIACRSFDLEPTVYRMQASACRRSSVAMSRDCWIAHFWEHGFRASWRCAGSA